MTDTSELAVREQRAQHGIIEFAEEMQAIRDGRLYPNAGETNSGKLEPWATYCRERWGMSKDTVDNAILASPVIARRAPLGARVLVTAAVAVAKLPEAVQDAILDSTEKRDDVKAKAKAVRKVVKQAEALGREASVEEQVEAAAQATPKSKPKKEKKRSRFTSAMEQAYYFIEQAADIAQGDTLTDVENDYAWNRVAKVRYQADRIEEKLYRPESVRDADEEFAELLAGEQA